MSAVFSRFALQAAISVAGVVAHEAGAEIEVRKPGAGEMRGLSVNPLIQGDYTSLETLAGRITKPALTKPQFASMDPADLTQFHLEVLDFLLPSSAKQAVSPTE
ncbi:MULTISPECIES: phage tail assembly protein [Sphingomonas]|uniref:phage tail assembly protein n=1 Tax=Sphingomonas TaxID=13687 RepID=UPI000F7DC73D|nr:phage tail assembly protein [Sphingomonas sp. ABOLF]RSV16260.1 phage tail assembly protein [Sphingomonas sp. ABOLF]GLK21482.1 hypothetical protein GCM10017606_23080 [Microbacterium terregens]